METSRREFLATAAATGAALHDSANERLDAFAIARRHLIVREIPTPNFFEGMLLGNGDIGVCVTVRPDALGLHIGKEDSWDIRVSEDHAQHVLPFKDLLKLWERASQEAKRLGRPAMLHLESAIDFFGEYREKVISSYRKLWPRPWPCGLVWIHWDARLIYPVRQVLDPSNGLLTVELEQDDGRGVLRHLKLYCFVHRSTNLVSVTTDQPAPFLTAIYYPNVDEEAELPAPELETAAGEGFAEFFCRQRFPATVPTVQGSNPPPSDKDRSLALCGRLQGAWSLEPDAARVPQARFRNGDGQPFRLDVFAATSRDHPENAAHARSEARCLSEVTFANLQRESERSWRQFWSKSAVEFADEELERLWYHNQYWLACCLKEGRVAPGLFGNWTSSHRTAAYSAKPAQIGTAWHGDYHMNYNTQQVYWGVFSSNHVEQHLPYVELCENLLPLSAAYARDNFGLPGAFFPHSAYPVPSQTIAYPVPPWGYEVCETPWTVQSLWWHYRYTLDQDYLRRVYPLMRAAARFMVAYVSKGEDGKYHIIPTVSPENWGFTVDFRLNRDCIMDLALTEFLLDAVVEASRILDDDAAERERWSEVRVNLTAYPRGKGPFGEVWVDVADAPAEHVQNTPTSLAPVFPGEQVGIGLREQDLAIARRTARFVRLEGGNDLVFHPIIRARLGTLDLAWFKREVRYCLLPNGTASDRIRQIDGRYSDQTDFDRMVHMGIWVENLALPAVLNECVMQSYSGIIRLFPNTRNLGPARFENLRAMGAFLVSAAWDGNAAFGVSIQSEKGAPAALANPWGAAKIQVRRARGSQPVTAREEGGVIRFQTTAGERYQVMPS